MLTILTTVTGEHPDLEELGAFIEGRLASADRRRIREHLDHCESCFEVVAETLAFQQDEEGSLSGSVIDAKTRFRRWFPTVIPLAAALLVASGLVYLLLDHGAKQQPSSAEELVGRLGDPSRLATSLGPGWQRAGWSSSRGSTNSLTLHRTSFRLGVRTVDLALVLRSDDSSQAAQILGDIAVLLENVPFAEAVSEAYRRVGDSLSEPATARTQAIATERLLLPLVDPSWFRFAQWAEAGRLAAAAGDLEYFAQSPARATVAPEAPPGLSARVRTEVESIEARRRSGITEKDLPPLAASFAEVVRRGGDD